LSVGESIQHIYTTLAILQQALYAVIDADLSPKLGTWKKKGLGVVSEKPGTWTLTKCQLNDAFSLLFYQIQDAWQHSSADTCKQIVEAYKDKKGLKPYPVTLMRQSDKDACINYFIKNRKSNLMSDTTSAEDSGIGLGNFNASIMSVPKKLCHWLFPETRTSETAVYAKDISYQTYDEVKFLSAELMQEGPYCHDALQYNCGRCPMCRKVWKARIKREIRDFNRNGVEKAAWKHRDKSKYGPQHKELTELEKCINLLITKWQRQDGITPSQPGESPFHTCPVCHYKVPPSKDTLDLSKEEARRCAETIDNLAERLTTQGRIKEKQEFAKNEDEKVPGYLKPVQISTEVIEGDWLTATHVVMSKETCGGGKIWTGRTIFPDASRLPDDDESSEEETDNPPQSRKVSFLQKREDDEQGRTILLTDCKHMTEKHHDTNKKKKNDANKDTLVEKSLNEQEEEHDGDGKSKDSKVMQQLYNVD